MTKKEWVEKLSRELKLRHYAESTISTYCGCLTAFCMAILSIIVTALKKGIAGKILIY